MPAVRQLSAFSASFTTSAMVDEGTKRALAQIPLLKTKASPRDGELWVQRLKEEYQSLIKVGETLGNTYRMWPYFVTIWKRER